MKPHPLSFDKPLSPLTKRSPLGTPRRVLGEIQNSPLANTLKHSPLIERTLSNITIQNSPVTSKRTNYSKISRVFEERTKYRMANKENIEQESFMKIMIEDSTTDSAYNEAIDSPIRNIHKSTSFSSWTMAKVIYIFFYNSIFQLGEID